MAHLICCCRTTLLVLLLLLLLLLLPWRWRIAALSLIAASSPSCLLSSLLLYPSTPAVSPSSSSSAPPPPPRLPHAILLTRCCLPLLETSCPHVSSHRRARHRSLLLPLCICFPYSSPSTSSSSSPSPSPSSSSCSACQIAGRAVHGQETCVPVPLSGLRGRQQRQAGGSSIEGRGHSDRHPRPTCCRCDRPQQLPFTTVDRVAAAVDASIEADQPGRVYAALRREGRGGQLLGCGGGRRACACATTASPLHRHLPRLPVVVGSRLLVVLLLLFSLLLSLLLSLPDRRQRQWWTDEGLRAGQQR